MNLDQVLVLEGWMTLPEAARRVGISHQAMRERIEAYRDEPPAAPLRIRRVGRVLIIMESDLHMLTGVSAAHQQRGRQGGRPSR